MDDTVNDNGAVDPMRGVDRVGRVGRVGRGHTGAGVTGRLRQRAERTAPDRNRHVDLLRAVAILAVVLGHWLLVEVTGQPGGGLSGRNVLALVPWSHPVTWVLQVMPIFFLVGGYANAASLASHRRRGGDARGWWLLRTDRLLRPTTALLVVLTAGALVARAGGAPPRLVSTAVWVASISLWFLLAYLAVVLLTPPMYALHQRFGLLVPLALAGLVGLGDLAGLVFGLGAPHAANYLLAWLAIHQVGLAWQDGRLPTSPWVLLPVACAGLATLVGLTTVGPYPVSMVGIPSEPVQNTAPPTLALLALATVQTGVAVALADRGNRWLQRRGPWTAVVAVNAVILTVFLWHMVTVVLTAVALHGLGLLPSAPVGSGGWLLLRLPWLACLALVLLLLVGIFGRIETHQVRPPVESLGALGETHRALDRALSAGLALGVAAVLAGLLGITFAGIDPDRPAGLPTAALLGYFAGATLLRVVRSATRFPRPRANRHHRSGSPAQ